jgi:ribose transport system substrate-binding protein
VTKKSVRLLIGVVIAALALAGCGSGSSSQSSASGGGQSGHKLTIALSNSYIGNKWRIEMENDFKSVCASAPWKDEIDCQVFNAGNDVSKQTQQISNMISSRVDAIVLDAASPTGLNGIVKQACDRGILVVSFDAVVTEPCAISVNTDQVKFGQQLAQWIVDKLGGKGNVIMVTGVSGTSVDSDRNKGAEAVWAANPGIKVVGRYTGEWDSATAQRNTAAQLPSLPQVDGIWAQGGTDGVIKAFLDAKRPVPPVAGEAENGFRKYLLPDGYNGTKVTGFSIGQPPYLSVVSLELAREVLQKKHEKQSITIPFPTVDNSTVKAGVNVFPDLEDSFFATFTDSGDNPVVSLCEDAALKGTACPQPSTVTLPQS